MSGPDLRPIAPALYRLRIPTERAYLLNCYVWVGPEYVAIIDTGWWGSENLVAGALEALGRRREDVGLVVLTHFHDDHVGSAAQIAGWSASTVVAGREDAPIIRGERPGPWPALTAAEQALDPPMPGAVAPPPPCRVDREVADGDVLDFGGGAVVVHVPGHTPGSIALHLPRCGVLLTGDVVAEYGGSVITGVFNTDRQQLEHSIDTLVATGAGIAGFGHGEAVLEDAAAHIAARTDPFG